MSSQVGTSRAPGHLVDARHDAKESTPRDRVARLLHDPKGYFADARKWAGGKAADDVSQELSKKKSRRMRSSPLLRALGFATR